MFTNPANNLVYAIGIIASIGFAAIAALIPLELSIVMLNGIYFGSIIGIVVTYWGLIKATIIGAPPFDRARQYALGVFAIWLAYTATVFISIISRAAGDDVTPYYIVAASRYVAIIAAWLQVTAPDFGDGFLFGRDRKILWSAVTISIIISIFIIFAQSQAVLATV